MENPTYRVYATTHFDAARDHRQIASIEVIPPISKELAQLVSTRVVQFFDENTAKQTSNSGNSKTEVQAFNFCDEGAMVNTVLRFRKSPTILSGEESARNIANQLVKVVQKVISPSGAAIARD